MKFASIVCFIALAGSARAQVVESAYFCREEFMGGLAFNDSRKVWEGAVFSSRHNFVLKTRPAGTKGTGKFALDTLNVTITKEGESSATSCLDLNQEVADMDKVVVTKSNILRCTATTTEFQFNRANNRFLTVYAFGFVNGSDNNDDTPYISGGRCTKIN